MNNVNNTSNNIQLDYEQTIAYFHALHDVRFKLLAFLPVISGAALLAIESGDHEVPVAILGGLITIALTLYDQRNTQIYDRLVARAQFLERKLGFEILPGDPNKSTGPVHSRPAPWGFLKNSKHRVLVPVVWHDGAVALIYAASLSAWLYIGFHSWWIAGVVFVADFVLLVRLAKLNDRDNDKIKAKIRAMRPAAQEAG